MTKKNTFIYTFFNAPWNVESFLRFGIDERSLNISFGIIHAFSISLKDSKLEQNLL